MANGEGDVEGMPETGAAESSPDMGNASRDKVTPPADDSTTARGMAQTLLQSMPEVKPHAIESVQHSGTEPAKAEAETFDPAIHAVKDGKPVRTKDGKFARRPGRKPAPGSVIGGDDAPGDVAGVQKLNAEDAARAAGAGIATMGVTMAVAIMGKEWLPRKEPVDEMEMLIRGVGDYCVAKGVKDVPPGVALLGICMMYALPRFAMPDTRSRLRKVKDWVILKIAHLRGRSVQKVNTTQAEAA